MDIVPAAAKVIQAPHLAAKSAKEASVAAYVKKVTEGEPDAAPAPAAPVPVDAAPAPADAAPAAPVTPTPTPAPTDAAPSREEFNQLLAINRQLVQKVMQRDQPVAPPPKADPSESDIVRAVRERDYDALERHGIKLEDWASRRLDSDPRDKTIAELQKRVETLTQWQSEQAETAQRREAEARIRRVEEIENQAKTVILEQLGADPELSILGLVAGAVDDVYSRIADHAVRTEKDLGVAQWLPPREAARGVFKAKAPELRKLLEAAKNHPSFQDLFQQTPPVRKTSPTVPTAATGSQLSGSAPPTEANPDREQAAIAVISQWLEGQRR